MLVARKHVARDEFRRGRVLSRQDRTHPRRPPEPKPGPRAGPRLVAATRRSGSRGGARRGTAHRRSWRRGSPRPRALEGVAERHPLHAQHLVALERLARGRQLRRQEEPDPLVGEAGCGPDPAERDQPRGGQAGLLRQLPRRADLGCLGAVEGAGRSLEQPAPRRVAVLAHQHGVPRPVHRQDRGRARMTHELQLADVAVGEPHALHSQVDDASAKHLPAVQSLAVRHRAHLAADIGRGPRRTSESERRVRARV